jgi:hypothetical protein
MVEQLSKRSFRSYVLANLRPLTDLGHVGSIVFGILLAMVAIWSLWRARARPGWFMPAVAAALAVGTIVSLADAAGLGAF